MTKHIEEFIPRAVDPAVQAVLNQFSEFIDEYVNYGSNIVKWDIERNLKADEHLPAVLFLRNYIEQIDAVSNLVKASSIEPCKNLLRTALENLFYLEYLLETDTYNRAMSFLAWNYINNNKNLLRLSEKSSEFKELEKLYLKDKNLTKSKPHTLANADELLDTGEKLLNSSNYLPFKNEYERTKKRFGYNFSWYSFFDGPQSIKKLADKLNHPVMYDIFFRNFSSATHGTDILQGKLIGDMEKELGILQIHDVKNAQHITMNCSNFCLMVYRTFIEKRIPVQFHNFHLWYLTVQEFHMKLGSEQLIKTE